MIRRLQLDWLLSVLELEELAISFVELQHFGSNLSHHDQVIMRAILDSLNNVLVRRVVKVLGLLVALGLSGVRLIQDLLLIQILHFMLSLRIKLLDLVPLNHRVNDELGELLPLHFLIAIDVDVMEELDQPIYELVLVAWGHCDGVLHQEDKLTQGQASSRLIELVLQCLQLLVVQEHHEPRNIKITVSDASYLPAKSLAPSHSSSSG